MLRRVLPMAAAVEVMKEAFAALARGGVAVAPRGALPCRGGTLLSMACELPGVGVVAKAATVYPGNAARGLPATHAFAMLFDDTTGVPRAVCDGSALTALRTGAASGAATDLLARTDAEVGAVIGCGGQARSQVLAIDCVRRLRRIRIAGRDRRRAEAFADGLRDEVRAELEVVGDGNAAVREADVVCTATSSPTPVFDGRLLRAGSHLNGIGSFRLDMQEVDVETVARSRVFVDALESAAAEAGDLAAAQAAGRTDPSRWTELGRVVLGEAPGRTEAGAITFFKSVGHAVQDAAALGRALAEARRLGLGTDFAT